MKNNYSGGVIRLLSLLAVLSLLVGVVTFKGQITTAIKRVELKDSPVLTELTSKAYIDKLLAGDGQFHPEEKTATWFNKDVSLSMVEMQNPPMVLGETTSNPNKWIEVDLNTQRLYAHDGNQIVYNMAVSTGLPWFPTVTGDFKIWSKVRAQRMTGGSIANGTFYDLPNVPFVQFFYKGYGLHGTYWHHDFGKPRSHGCVNLSISDAEKLFNWTDPQMESGKWAMYKIEPTQATRIIIYGTTPTNL